jgi:hypothetical protein
MFLLQLDKVDQFSPEQVERLVTIPGQNKQVGWIIEDADVHTFYAKLLDGYAKVLKQETVELLVALVEAANHTTTTLRYRSEPRKMYFHAPRRIQKAAFACTYEEFGRPAQRENNIQDPAVLLQRLGAF